MVRISFYCNLIWTHMLFPFPSSLPLNLRRSAALRTRWQLWGKTMKSASVPTLLHRGICRRTSSPLNTSFYECRSSWPWQRRCVTVSGLYLAWCEWIQYIQLLSWVHVSCLQELEKKFQQTAAYRNMKEILTKKNEQIKEIRKRLQRWRFIFKKDPQVFHTLKNTIKKYCELK